MPEEFGPYLGGHDVKHVGDMGWQQVTNGKLLDLAEANGFQVLITKDSNIPYQQNLAGRKISLLVLKTTSQALDELFALTPQILTALNSVSSNQVLRIS